MFGPASCGACLWSSGASGSARLTGVRVIQRAALVGAGLVDSWSLCRRNGGSSGQSWPEAVMAVTLSCQQVQEQVRVVDVFDNMPIRPGVSRPRVLSDAFWMGKFKTAKALVEGYAPKAPS